MKNMIVFNEAKEPSFQTFVAANHELHTFCATYSLPECHQLLCNFFRLMASGNYESQSKLSKKQLMDYFLALERMIPALYELEEKLRVLQKEEGEQGTYRDEVSANQIYAACKRHPE